MDSITRLKLLIDTKSNKVLFAEASKEFVDLLFSLLSLPIGTVIRLLTKKSMVGCLGKLYGSIENVSETYMQSNEHKDCLLKPTISTSTVPLFLSYKTLFSDSLGPQLYSCEDEDCKINNVTDDPSAICPDCDGYMSRSLNYIDGPVKKGSAGMGGYVKGDITFMVMDDLVVKPMSTISSITMFSEFNIKNAGVLCERFVTFGRDEALKLLKTSLESNTVLTSVFLRNKVA